MGVPREIELKLELDPSAAKRFRTRILPSLTPDGGETRRLVSSYFDTSERDLAERGLSLRVRRDGERRVQTLKAEGTAGAGFFDRPEWECDIEGDEPDLAEFGRPARRLAATMEPLAKLFETAVDRTAWLIDRGDGCEIEVALDEGLVSAGDVSQAIAEIELELKRGSPADLFRLARALGEAAPVRLGVRTKSERGYALAAGPARVGVKAEPVAIDPDFTAGEAFQTIARSCLRHFRLNEAALVEDRAVEALHQARVALRRLRSALSIFYPVVRDDVSGRLRAGLRDVSRLLGEARNLDVLLARTDGRGPAEDELVERLRADRDHAYDRVGRRLGSKRFRLTTLDLAAWIEAGPYLSDDARAKKRDAPVAKFAAGVLDRRARKVRKAGRRLDTLEPEARHRVRIEAKKLRYASEFFAGLVEGGKRKRRHKAFLAALQDLQACLGDLNDLATAATLTEGVTVAADGAIVASGTVDGAAADAEREAELVRCAVEAHAALRDVKPFWTW